MTGTTSPAIVRLTPEQATKDAVAALKEAGFGKEHGRPAYVVSRSLGRSDFGMGPEMIRTEVKVKRADQDDALWVMILLPHTVTCSATATAVIADRDAEVRESGSDQPAA